MIALLDVNVLVALFDALHAHHEITHQWFATNRASGWAACPLTENATFDRGIPLHAVLGAGVHNLVLLGPEKKTRVG